MGDASRRGNANSNEFSQSDDVMTPRNATHQRRPFAPAAHGRPHPLLRLTLLSAAIAATACVHAQQAAQTGAAQDGSMQKVEIRGAADAYDPRRDDTAAKIVVGHDELAKYGDTSVVDALKRVPGVSVGSGARGTEVRMRGLGNGYTQILIDGERAPANFSIESLSPDVIERIEVLRVASAEFSTQSIAGTINIVLKKAVKAGQRTAKLGYAHGSATDNPNASLNLSDRRGQLSYSLAASASRTRNTLDTGTLEQRFGPGGQLLGARLSSEPEVDHVTMLNVTPRLTWTFAGGDTLTSQTFFNFNDYEFDTAGRVGTLLGPLDDYPSIDRHRKTIFHIVREELDWIHKFDGGAKLDANVSGLASRISEWIRRTGSGNPDVPPLHENIPAGGDERGVTTMGKLSTTARAGHTLAVGWDAGRSTLDAYRRDRDTLQPDVLLDADQDYDVAVSRLALYAQDDWTITPAWSAYFGVRWEGILIRTEGNTFPTAHSRSAVWSPLFQTLYKLPGTKGDQVRFALSRTYKAPDLLNLLPLRFKSGNNTQTNPDMLGNPNLQPELAFGFDAAWEHYWAQGALLSATVSGRRISDYTRRQLTFDGATWTSIPINAGNAKTYGLELEAKFPLKAAFDTTLPLDLRASLSRNWSHVDEVPGPDNRLDAQTPLSATLGADYTRAQLTVGGSYVFKNGGLVRVLANQTSYQSVRRDLDLYAAWQFDPKLQLRVTAANLLAQDRIGASDFVFDADGSQSARTLVPSHRSVRATLQWKF